MTGALIYHIIFVITDGTYIQLQGCYENSGVTIPTRLASDNITPRTCVNECENMRYSYAAIGYRVSSKHSLCHSLIVALCHGDENFNCVISKITLQSLMR